MSDLISMDKDYRTRNSRPVRILSIDLKNSSFPVVGAVVKHDSEELVQFSPHGVSSLGSDFDLIEVDLIEVKPRIKHDIWVNVYSGKSFTAHPDKESSDRLSSSSRLACVKVEIDCEHGEGI